MKISDNTVVSLAYELRVDNESGEVVDKAEGNKPFTFLVGAGNVLEEFENNIMGKEQGDAFAFSIDKENAYGPVDERAVVEVPKDVFMVDGKLATDLLKEGHYLQMQDQNGNPLRGKVVNVDESAVTMDFNHPMAGKDLYFSGSVMEVREATEEEIDHGHAHGVGGHHH